MMYHFMFGLVETGADSGAPPETAFCSPAGCSLTPFFSSSCMSLSFKCLSYAPIFFRNSTPMGKSAQQPIHRPADHRIHSPKEKSEQEYGNDYDSSGGLHFLKRRRCHFLHFGAHIVVKNLSPLRP